MAIEGREGDEWMLRAELPGVDPGSDIDVSITHHVLHIRAPRGRGPQPGDHPSDVYFGDFTRDVALPPDVDEDRIIAAYSAGVLEIRAPTGRGVKATERRVPVAAPK